jgi:hypothetical protein
MAQEDGGHGLTTRAMGLIITRFFDREAIVQLSSASRKVSKLVTTISG